MVFDYLLLQLLKQDSALQKRRSVQLRPSSTTAANSLEEIVSMPVDQKKQIRIHEIYVFKIDDNIFKS